MMYIRWEPVLKRAAEIVLSYDTGVTLRQLFYRLVSEQLIPNTQNYYSTLSSKTAEARRWGEFPDLIDQTSRIEKAGCFESPQEAREYIQRVYRRDRTEGQRKQIYLIVEKAGMIEQLKAWFFQYGVSIIALGGYASQTLLDRIKRAVYLDGRESVMIYAGDFDPTGDDIPRDFMKRCNVFDHVEHIALRPEHIKQYNLAVNPAKAKDTRNEGFRSKYPEMVELYGDVIQVELDALDPSVLRQLYADAFMQHFDMSDFKISLDREELDREELAG